MNDLSDIRDTVRKKYAEAIRGKRTCCGSGSSCCGSTGPDPITEGIYQGDSRERIPDPVLGQSLGCGSPVEMANLKPGKRCWTSEAERALMHSSPEARSVLPARSSAWT